MSPVTALPFLPFAKPTLDESTIRSVGEVLASGWITSGPKVTEFEAELSKLFAHRPLRAFANGTATLDGAALSLDGAFLTLNGAATQSAGTALSGNGCSAAGSETLSCTEGR